MDTLPEELVDTMLEQFDSADWIDKQSLLSCSLVCKSWLRLSRRHIFRSMTVVISDSKIMTQDDDSIEPEELLEFVQGNSEISGCIRELTLQLPKGFGAPLDLPWNPEEGYFPPRYSSQYIALLAKGPHSPLI